MDHILLSGDDPKRYRAAEEQEWKEKDPLIRTYYLDKKGLWSEEKEKAWTEEVNKEIDEAMVLTEKHLSKKLAIIKNVFVDTPATIQEQIDKYTKS